MMTDVIVLAKHTPQITIGQKNRPGAITANKGRFLPMMGKNTRNPQFTVRPAIAHLAIHAVDPAPTRTELTGFENLFEAFNPVLQFPTFVETEICRYKRHWDLLWDWFDQVSFRLQLIYLGSMLNYHFCIPHSNDHDH